MKRKADLIVKLRNFRRRSTALALCSSSDVARFQNRKERKSSGRAGDEKMAKRTTCCHSLRRGVNNDTPSVTVHVQFDMMTVTVTDLSESTGFDSSESGPAPP